jgi:hypothetical protein
LQAGDAIEKRGFAGTRWAEENRKSRGEIQIYIKQKWS